MINLCELQKQHAKYEGVISVKFPNVDREERIVKKSTALIVELSELANEAEQFFKFFKVNVRNDKDKQLKEAADCLAYYLGLANEVDLEYREPNMDLIRNCRNEPNKNFKDAVREATYIDYGQGANYVRLCILKSFSNFIKFLHSIGLEFEEVKETYLNHVLADNLKRQEENY